MNPFAHRNPLLLTFGQYLPIFIGAKTGIYRSHVIVVFEPRSEASSTSIEPHRHWPSNTQFTNHILHPLDLLRFISEISYPWLSPKMDRALDEIVAERHVSCRELFSLALHRKGSEPAVANTSCREVVVELEDAVVEVAEMTAMISPVTA